MNRRAVKPLLAAAVMVLATFFALFVLTPSNADEIPDATTTSTSPSGDITATATAGATATASSSASSQATVGGGKNCGDCQITRD
jgi:polyferredoxin